MKNLFLVCALCVATIGTSFAGGYKLDEAAIESAFASAEDVSLDVLQFSNAAPPAENPTVGGYLLRAFFCGFIGLHRSYMGTGGKTLWYYYLCIPVYGGIVGCVDFWGVVFKGDEQLAKYKDNPKFNVWAGGGK